MRSGSSPAMQAAAARRRPPAEPEVTCAASTPTSRAMWAPARALSSAMSTKAPAASLMASRTGFGMSEPLAIVFMPRALTIGRTPSRAYTSMRTLRVHCVGARLPVKRRGSRGLRPPESARRSRSASSYSRSAYIFSPNISQSQDPFLPDPFLPVLAPARTSRRSRACRRPATLHRCYNERPCGNARATRPDPWPREEDFRARR